MCSIAKSWLLLGIAPAFSTDPVGTAAGDMLGCAAVLPPSDGARYTYLNAIAVRCSRAGRGLRAAPPAEPFTPPIVASSAQCQPDRVTTAPTDVWGGGLFSDGGKGNESMVKPGQSAKTTRGHPKSAALRQAACQPTRPRLTALSKGRGSRRFDRVDARLPGDRGALLAWTVRQGARPRETLRRPSEGAVHAGNGMLGQSTGCPSCCSWAWQGVVLTLHVCVGCLLGSPASPSCLALPWKLGTSDATRWQGMLKVRVNNCALGQPARVARAGATPWPRAAARLIAVGHDETQHAYSRGPLRRC